MPLFPGDEGYGKKVKRKDVNEPLENALAVLRGRGYDLDSMDESSPEYRELVSETMVEIYGGYIKRAKKSDWGVAPWILDDMGLLNAPQEEIEAAFKKLEAEEKAKQKAAHDQRKAEQKAQKKKKSSDAANQ